MKKNIFKWLLILFQSVFIGSTILYVYALIKYKKNWDNLDKGLKENINTYLIIAIASIVVYIIIKIIDYLLNKPKTEKTIEEKPIIVEKIINEEYQHDEIIPSIQIKEEQQPLSIPKEKQAICPNCGSVVDKGAYICLTCGILLGDLDQKPKQEKVIYKEIVVKNGDTEAKSMFKNVVLVVLVVLIMFVAYDYSRNNGVLFSKEMTQAEKKEYFYDIAVEVINNIEYEINNNKIKIDLNNTYILLSDRSYSSSEYNPNKSYVAISRERKYYLIFVGQGKYKDYYINGVLKEDLTVSSVEINNDPILPIEDDNRLSIDGQYFYKNSQ